MFDLLTYLAEVVTEDGNLPGGYLPLHDDVVVLPLKESDRTAGGILMAEQHRDRPVKGVVVACGPGAWNDDGSARVKMDVRIGDVVLFGQFAGRETVIGGTPFLLMRDRECSLRRPYGRYELIAHPVHEGTPFARTHYHEAEDRCDLCPKPVSEVIAAERARLVAEQNASLQHEDLGDAVALMEAEGAPALVTPE